MSKRDEDIGGRTRVKSGRKVVSATGTAVVLGSGNYQYIIIQAETNNTGGIVIGDSALDETLGTRTGYYLNPGEATPILPIVDLGDLWLDANVSGDGVHYIAFSLD